MATIGSNENKEENDRLSEEDKRKFKVAVTVAQLGDLTSEIQAAMNKFELNLIDMAKDDNKDGIVATAKDDIGLQGGAPQRLATQLAKQFSQQGGSDDGKETLLKRFEPSVLNSWCESHRLEIWYQEKLEFKSESDLIKDMDGCRISTCGEGRQALINHLLKTASELGDESSSRSPPSNVLSGVAGIGKTLMQIEVGSRIPKLYPNICVVYLLMSALPTEDRSIPISQVLLPYCKKISGKKKCLLFLDDSEAVFRPENDSGFNFVAALTELCRPEVGDVVVEIFGSSQVLKDLIQRNMTDETALKLGYKGYCKYPAKLNGSKLPVYYPYSAQSLGEVEALSASIASQFNKVNSRDDDAALTWYCSGIARLICYFYGGVKTKLALLLETWTKIREDSKSLEYYHQLAAKLKYNNDLLMEKVQTWDDLRQFTNENSMFDFIEATKKNQGKIEFDNQLHLLAKGNVKQMDGVIVPTFPICVLIESVRANGKQLFCEGALMEPNVHRSDMEAKAEEAKKNGEGALTVQSYQLWAREFKIQSGLPNLEQLDLALKKLPNVLPNNKEPKSKYHGTISIDLLNFGVINEKISMREADKAIGKFGQAYFDLCKRLAENGKNTIEYCNAFHRSGDEFAVVCLFDDENEFEMIVRELASIIFEASSKDGKTKVVAYGRVGGYYRECSRSMVDSFERAKRVEKSIKDKIAEHFKFANAAEMKNAIKRKDGPDITFAQKDLNILWDIEDDSPELTYGVAHMSIDAQK